MPKTQTFDYPVKSKPVKRQRADTGNEDDIGWTVYTKKENEPKPIKAPSREVFERFSAKSRQSMDETLS